MSQTMTDEQIENLRQYRAQVTANETATLLAWNEAVNRIEEIREHLDARNYGLADEAIADLLGDLPHDDGGPVTHTPMLDRHREREYERAGIKR